MSTKTRTLKDEILTYEKMCREGLELEHFGKWVIVYEGEIKGVFDTEQRALINAVRKFKDAPYLVTQVGETDGQIRQGMPAVLGMTSMGDFKGAQCREI